MGEGNLINNRKQMDHFCLSVVGSICFYFGLPVGGVGVPERGSVICQIL